MFDTKRFELTLNELCYLKAEKYKGPEETVRPEIADFFREICKKQVAKVLSHPERKEGLREWYHTYQKQHYEELKLKDRRKVFAIISKNIEPECVNCGCDDIRLLEVNHKNGGGGVRNIELGVIS